MRLAGGLGQLWATARQLAKVFLLSQLASPLVAWLAVFVASSVGLDTVLDTSSSPFSLDQVIPSPTTTAPAFELLQPSACCGSEPQSAPCPSDHTPASPDSPECMGASDRHCSNLPLACLACSCDYSCSYGQQSNATCQVSEGVECEGEREFSRQFRCSYCYLSDSSSHLCSNRNIGCRSVGSPTSRAHWYIANCSLGGDTVCLGRGVFSKKVECNWTEGYSWKTALVLSVTLGGFGADRFYLGHWQEGIGKLFSFGGLGVWTLVDVVLVSIGYIGPADGSLYI